MSSLVESNTAVADELQQVAAVRHCRRGYLAEVYLAEVYLAEVYLAEVYLAEVTWLWIYFIRATAVSRRPKGRGTADFAYCERFFQIAALWRKKALRRKAPESA
jgi:hypothetical protein